VTRTASCNAGEEAPSPVSQRGAALVFYEEAGVLDDEEAGGVRFGGGFGVGNSLLQPEGFGVDGDGGLGDGRDVLGPPKDIDDVDGEWNVFEASIRFFAKNLGFVGVDGDDFVADALEVGGDFVGRAAGVGREADDGDGFGRAKKVADRVGGYGRAFGRLHEHVRWMSGNGKRVEQKVASGKVKERDRRINAEGAEGALQERFGISGWRWI